MYMLLVYTCLPGLHISIGIFQRLYALLEEECHELDLQIARTQCSQEVLQLHSRSSAWPTEEYDS